jgi:hypothetical protein
MLPGAHASPTTLICSSMRLLRAAESTGVCRLLRSTTRMWRRGRRRDASCEAGRGCAGGDRAPAGVLAKLRWMAFVRKCLSLLARALSLRGGIRSSASSLSSAIRYWRRSWNTDTGRRPEMSCWSRGAEREPMIWLLESDMQHKLLKKNGSPTNSTGNPRILTKLLLLSCPWLKNGSCEICSSRGLHGHGSDCLRWRAPRQRPHGAYF